jgi:hypothetical protein
LGLFIFGVFLSFGIIAHYCSGARWPTGELFLRNITLWYAGPWTLAVADVQAGGLGMVALGLARLLASRLTNIISRTIAPLIYVPSITTSFGAAALGEVTTAANAGRAGVSETFGLGDINQTSYFSPAAPARSFGAWVLPSICRLRLTTSSGRANSASVRGRWDWSCRNRGLSAFLPASCSFWPAPRGAPT